MNLVYLWFLPEQDISNINIGRMEKMRAEELRSLFLDFFAKREHKVFPSDSLIPSGDPTLLFTSAGMVQFKDYFSGKLTGLKRACSCQKCFRTSDIEKIGRTVKHLSFFEMLGNFSFGDYFKREAIYWAWEFLVDVIKLPTEKLFASVYTEDDEAFNIWSEILPKEKIYKFGMDSNFWLMGETGPCGPCSEIIYDRGKEYGCGRFDCNPSCECERWLEVWNLVFTQYDRQPDGTFVPLKQKNIDTGLGLERLLAVINENGNLFKIELFSPLIEHLRKISKRIVPEIYLRIIADHLRACVFLVCDGIIPSNVGRGYLLRRLLRRAVRYAKLCDFDLPSIHNLVENVIEIMKSAYNELENKKEIIVSTIKLEEEKFLETLETGMNILTNLIQSTKSKKENVISGTEVFRLYDTYGFPPELSEEILNEAGLTYDKESYEKELHKSVEISKASWKSYTPSDFSTYEQTTEFIGYTHNETATKIVEIFIKNEKVDILPAGQLGEIILQITPFYGESGGQVGDKGSLLAVDGEPIAEVIDTKRPRPNLIIHCIKSLKELFNGQTVIAKVDTVLRERIKKNHTATHLLHKVLRTYLGEHAKQHGSLVAPDRLRFDFFHPSSLTKEQIKTIEDLVNEKIFESLPVFTFETTFKKAMEYNAVALFGEKYSDTVRCVMIGTDKDNPGSAYSLELCGGTHVKNTSELGIFKIISETSIASGVRRIEAICGTNVIEYIRNLESLIYDIKTKLKASDTEILQKLETLMSRQSELEKELKRMKEKILTTTEVKRHKIGEINLIIQEIENVEDSILRSIADTHKSKNKEKSIILLINKRHEKVSFVLTITNDLIKVINAIELGKNISNILGGSAGGRIDFCEGGGKKTELINEAINSLIQKLNTL